MIYSPRSAIVDGTNLKENLTDNQVMPSHSLTILMTFYLLPGKLLNTAKVLSCLLVVRHYFGNTREIFAITALGSKFYVVTAAQDVAEAYRNTTTLSFDQFVMALMRVCGSSEACVEAMFRPLPRDKEGFPNPHGKALARLSREIHIHQLFPGEGLDVLDARFAAFFKTNLRLEEMATCLPAKYATTSNDREVVLPLMIYCSDIFIRGGQTAYFGDGLARVDPNLTWSFLEFDELSWQVLYQYPKILSRRMNAARKRMITSLNIYFSSPASSRPDDIEFVRRMEDEMRDLGIGNHDIATMMLTMYWGINTNTRKAAFWMIAYILHTDGLLEAIREETKSAFAAEGDKIDVHYLSQQCPILDGVWNETIRMSAYSASVRYVTEDTLVGNKILRQGHRVMVPYRQLHFNAEVFGEEINRFKADRFVKDGSLIRKSTWRPFGGGQTMCPGRFVAKNAVVTFMALLFRRFDLELAYKQPFPRAEMGNPVLGIMANKRGDDLMVRFKVRKD
jgi:Cytochrome P450